MSQASHIQAQTKKPDALKDFAFVYEQVVVWNDMDAFNHVNNVVYYRYAESARIQYLLEVEAFDDTIMMILAHSSCKYILPVNFPDTLLIGVRIKKLGNTSIVIEYAYYSTEQQALVAQGDSVLVRVNMEGTDKVSWSEKERKKIIALEQKVGHSPEH